MIHAPSSAIPSLIGKRGKKIAELEEIFGFSLEVEPLAREKIREEKVPVEVEMKKKTVRLHVGEALAHRKVSVYANGEHLFDAVVSREGYINLRKGTSNGKKIMRSLKDGVPIYVLAL